MSLHPFARKLLPLARRRAALLACALLALAALLAFAGLARAGGTRTPVIADLRRLDVNRLDLPVDNAGTFGAPLRYPAGGAPAVLSAGGLWIGAKVGSGVRVAGGGYAIGFHPGAMVGGFSDDPARPQYRVWKVRRWSGSPADTAHVTRVTSDGDTLVHHAWSEYLAGAAPYGAPTRNWRLPLTATADPTDSVDVPGPDVKGDLMLWAVYNAAAPAAPPPALGVEVRQTLFAFERADPLGDAVFAEFRICNRGADTLDSTYVSLWADPDVGDASDDLVGVDLARALGFAYNRTHDDMVYGATPPAVGCLMSRGALDRASGGTLGLTNFHGYIKAYDGASIYHLMRTLDPSGQPVTDPTTGLPTSFTYTGDPVAGTGWLPGPLYDPRMLLSSGPFTLAPGDSQVIAGAIVAARGADRLASVDVLRLAADFARGLFARGYEFAQPPSPPTVSVEAERDRVALCWDEAARSAYRETGYAFQGFNVWQGAGPSGPWTRLATWDESDGVRVVADDVLDPARGIVLHDAPVGFGTDSGIRFCHEVARDTLRGGPLVSGTEYWFAVSAYAVGAGEKPRVLESPLAVVAAIPQRPAPGSDPGAASALPVVYRPVDPSVPATTDRITVEVVDPARVTGHRYRVGFTPLEPPFSGRVAGDTATVTSGWNLTDLTAGLSLLSGRLNRRGGDDYPVADGLRVRVVGSYFPKLVGARYQDLPNSAPRALDGVNGGLPFFGGGAGVAKPFFGSLADPVLGPQAFGPVEIHFDRRTTQRAYRFLRYEKLSDGGEPPQGRQWLYGGFHTVPFTVWDVSRSMQLDVVFTERVYTDDAGNVLPRQLQAATLDSTWAPDTSGSGGHEILAPMRLPYTGTPHAAVTQDGAIGQGSLPLLYVLWARQRYAGAAIDDGDLFRFDWVIPAAANDRFEFDTTPATHGAAAGIRAGLALIRAVPNPYRLLSRYDRPAGRVLRFINMPERAEVWIFNLGGSLVRTLSKDDPSSVLEWDLLTEHGRPVGSGVYVYRVEAPGAGSTFGRLVVFMGD
ncbi:MAG: hypothetical protein HZC42_06455 [Candidatus Eisenbacteria bacterium]|nr:hypothetical protein [Candidatus Eisenbacteria bacterium]